MLLITETVLPGLGVGRLRFGMTRDDVHSFWGKPTSEGSRGATWSEWFDNRYCYVYFAPNGEVEGFEFGRGAVDLVYEGESLFAMSGPDMVRWLTNRDPGVQEISGSYVSTRLGIAAYAPDLEVEPTDPVDGIMIFRHGATVMSHVSSP